MIYKGFNRFFCKVRDGGIILTRHSALFIPGTKATEQFVYLVPFVDFPERIGQRELLLKEIDRRKSNVELGKLESLWQVFKDLNEKKLEYIKQKEEISKELGRLITDDPENEAIKKLKIQTDLLKDNLKKLKVPLWSAEEAAMIEVLKLPNKLHSQTPDDTNRVLYTHLSPPTCKKDHLKVGKELNIIDLKSNINYYLKGDAAVFELGAKFYFSKILKQHRYVQFSNPDFVKSLIVEGCGKNHTRADATFILHDENSNVSVDSRLHLTGGGSLYSFMAYHAKHVLYAKVLPLKYFTMGRQYIPATSDNNSLFHVSQSSVIETFGAAKTAEELDQMLDDFIETLKEAYTKLGYHFRLSIIAAEKLHFWESLRIAVEMYSTSLQDYVEVANVSLSGDFISKRLMFTYVDNKKSMFPHILSGTLLNVPRVLACVLEQDTKFSVPELLKIQNWTL